MTRPTPEGIDPAPLCDPCGTDCPQECDGACDGHCGEEAETTLTPLCAPCDTDTCPQECEGDCDGHCSETVADSGCGCSGAPESALPAVRVDLQVAPKRNAMGRYEIHSGSREAVSVDDALALIDAAVAAGLGVKHAKICGPGDALATPELTLETMRRARERHPGLHLALVTNGLNAAPLAEHLAKAGVDHVTLLVDAVDPSVAAGCYAWIRPGRKTMPVAEAAAVLVEEQAAALSALSATGMDVVVRTVVYPGVNDMHVGDIARTVARLGARALRLVPFEAPAEGGSAPFGMDQEGPVLPPLAEDAWESLSAAAAEHIELITGAENCTANQYGSTIVDLADLDEGRAVLNQASTGSGAPKPGGDRPHVAVATSDGFDVDMHLGKASFLMIYGRDEQGLVRLLETRPMPAPGGGDDRWKAVAELVSDCRILLAASVGARPTEVLSESGLYVLKTTGNVEGLVDVLYGGGKKGRGKRR